VYALVNPIQTVDGKYRIVRLLGEGGMGAVYEARHLGTGRRVAVKVIVGDALEKSDDDVVARFQREARAAGAIESQHIAQVLDTGVDPAGGFPYIVIEYLEGEDLSKTVARLGPLPPGVALRIASQACAGLHKAHLSKVVHRDIKPANLYLVRQDGNEVVVKLLDFGIAKIALDPVLSNERAVLTTTGMMLGSPLYMSPEQARGSRDVDHRSDVWSLGVVLHECLSGTTPHARCSSFGELILAICGEHRPLLDVAPWVGPEIGAIVDKALAIDPARRFQSAKEMGEALREVLKGGHGIDESMLVPLPPDVRGPIAPRYAASSSRVARMEAVTGAISSAVTLPVAAGLTGSAPIATTTSVPEAPDARQQPRVSVALVSLLVAGSLLGVGGIGFRVYRASMQDAAAQSGVPVASSAASAPGPAPGPAEGAAGLPRPPVLHSVPLAIVPPEALVDIDDAGASSSGGTVELTGTLGSTHAVHVRLGKLETTAIVAVTETGPVPARVELTPTAPSASSGKATGTSSGGRRANAPAEAAHGPPSRPSPPAATDSAIPPAVRDFN
jgi:serine/threonine protein kinase